MGAASESGGGGQDEGEVARASETDCSTDCSVSFTFDPNNNRNRVSCISLTILCTGSLFSKRVSFVIMPELDYILARVCVYLSSLQFRRAPGGSNRSSLNGC